jgi:hypothetical protein
MNDTGAIYFDDSFQYEIGHKQWRFIKENVTFLVTLYTKTIFKKKKTILGIPIYGTKIHERDILHIIRKFT